jgi:hypothetical protein
MKQLLALFILVPAILYCNGRPKIQFDSLIYDFGEQNRNVELRHIFTFENKGNAVLTIEKIVPS